MKNKKLKENNVLARTNKAPTWQSKLFLDPESSSGCQPEEPPRHAELDSASLLNDDYPIIFIFWAIIAFLARASACSF